MRERIAKDAASRPSGEGHEQEGALKTAAREMFIALNSILFDPTQVPLSGQVSQARRAMERYAEICVDARLKPPAASGEGRERLDLREALAVLAHEQWSGWMRHLFSKCCFDQIGNAPMTAFIPAEWLERWSRQVSTPYAQLSEAEKESDRKEADRVLAILPAASGEGWQEK